MVQIVTYLGAAAAMLGVAAFGLMVLLGGAAELGKEIATFADSRLTQTVAPGISANEASAAAKTTGTAAEPDAARPQAQKARRAKPAAGKRKKRAARPR